MTLEEQLKNNRERLIVELEILRQTRNALYDLFEENYDISDEPQIFKIEYAIEQMDEILNDLNYVIQMLKESIEAGEKKGDVDGNG